MAPKKKIEEPSDEKAVETAPETAKETAPAMPEKLPMRMISLDVEGKTYQFPVFFTAEQNGLVALYGPDGKRASGSVPAGSPDAKYLAKAAARYNVIRRKNARTADFRG